MAMSNPTKVTVSGDLQRERSKCTFDPAELTHLLDGSPTNTAKRRKIEEFFLCDERLKDKVPVRYLSYKEFYENSVKKACIALEKLEELGATGERDLNFVLYTFGGRLSVALFKEGTPMGVHWLMFIPTIKSQGTVEQQNRWLSRAWNCGVLGTYAQTELGHGTFIRGLQTTATYDPNTTEFILDSPELTSYKWWPGGLGNSVNYAVVLAQLYTRGKCKGVHPFIVQLRDEETHEPLPGITIGDIGVKLAQNGNNNGFLGFKQVRIPRDQMLMKNSQVLEDGTYVKAPHDKLTYGSMVLVRVLIVESTYFNLFCAATIAIRYSAIRRQGQIDTNKPEVQVIDYVTQQYKLFPHLASGFALSWAARWITRMYHNVTAELNEGQMDRLPELHAIACCLKAISSLDATQGVEELRLSCGGHGYMESSNFPSIFGRVTAAQTYEGENTVLLLQTARYLTKAYRQAIQGKPLTPTVEYLNRLDNGYWKNSLACYVTANEQVAAGKIKLACESLERRMKCGKSPEIAWNETSIELAQAAESHCRAFIVSKSVEAINDLRSKISQPLHDVLVQLCELYALYWILRRLGDFLQFSCLDKNDVRSLQKKLEDCLAAIRPNAVGIVDGIDIHDGVLDSALGAYDGDVYNRLFKEALKSPLNQESVNEAYQKYLRPFMKSRL